MAGLDPIRILLIGAAAAIVLVFLGDTAMPSFTPTLRRYQARYLPAGLSWKVFVTPGVLVVLSLLMRVPVISFYLLVAAALVLWRDIRRLERERKRLNPDQILQFVMAFRAEYTLQPSVFSMMEKVMDRTTGPLRNLMKVTAQAFFLTASPQRAFEELRRRSDNVYLNQFAYILEMAENASPEAVIKALQGLELRLRSHSELRREVQSNLASIGTQTMIMQAVAGAILVGVALVPMLRQAYTTPFGQFVYVGVLTVMLASSYYIDQETRKLAERIS
jgi:Flp pilus assembly protein TadB